MFDEIPQIPADDVYAYLESMLALTRLSEKWLARRHRRCIQQGECQCPSNVY